MKIMTKASTFFLRVAIIAIGTAVLALCIFALPAMWKAVSEDYLSHTYVFYSILSVMYLSVVPFYIALYQVLRLLRYIDTHKAFSMLSVKALKYIAYCALAISLLYAASMPFFYIWADNDDAPGLIIVNMFMVLAPFTIAVFAAVLQRVFREALEIKSENDLTV